MKNIQEILLKCDGVGKLILGDEAIDISVTSTKSSIQRIDGYRDMDMEYHKGESVVCTKLEVCIFGEDFCRAVEKKA